ncbi:cytochrome P450 [Streptomyces sp. NPDC001719]
MTAQAPGPFRTADVPLADPYPCYRRYRESDPVHLGPDGSWYVFRHRDVAHVLADRRYGRGNQTARIPAECPHLRHTVANWMVFMDPPRHTAVRALVAKSFTPRIVEALRPRIRRLAVSLVAALGEEREADLVDRLAAPFPLLVISELLGVPREDRAWFRARALDLQQATASRVARTPDGFAVADSAARELDAYFRAELARRRARPAVGADLIGAMLEHAGAASADDDTLVGTCIHLLTAGHETTTNVLCKGLLALFAHPGQLAALRARPELTVNAVEELVRYDSPVQMITRQAGEPDRMGGRAVPAGSRVVLVLGSANRDPERFPGPDRLDLTRDARRHSGFGMGIHYCVGAPLARAEAEIGLTELLRGLPRLALAGQPVYAKDLVFHGPARMPVRTR